MDQTPTPSDVTIEQPPVSVDDTIVVRQVTVEKRVRIGDLKAKLAQLDTDIDTLTAERASTQADLDEALKLVPTPAS